MRLSEIISTLSDTELIAMAIEVNDPNISNGMIVSQLLSKSNDGEANISDIDKFAEILSYELAKRLRESNQN